MFTSISWINLVHFLFGKISKIGCYVAIITSVVATGLNAIGYSHNATLPAAHLAAIGSSLASTYFSPLSAAIQAAHFATFVVTH